MNKQELLDRLEIAKERRTGPVNCLSLVLFTLGIEKVEIFHNPKKFRELSGRFKQVESLWRSDVIVLPNTSLGYHLMVKLERDSSMIAHRPGYNTRVHVEDFFTEVNNMELDGVWVYPEKAEYYLLK